MTAPTEPGRPGPEALGQEHLAAPLDLDSGVLPPRHRPDAALSILDVTKYFGPTSGGIRTYLLEKARYVTRHPALRHILVVPGERDATIDVGGTRCYRVAGPRIPTQKQYRALIRRGTLARLIAHERPDVVEIGSSILVPWVVRGAIRNGGPPTVWFYHTHLPGVVTLHDTGPGRLVRRLLARYLAAIARGAQATFAASTFAETALRSVGAERIHAVSLGVDLEGFHPERRRDAEWVRRELDLPAGPFALYLGRIAREKCLGDVIAAWPEVARRTGIGLLVVGDGPARSRLVQGRGNGVVQWRPFVARRDVVAGLVAAAAFIVAPGPFETFGLSALEGLASGVPVLAVDHGAAAELVERSGAGAVYPRGDRSAIARTAIELAESDRVDLGRLGRRYAEAHHGWDTVMERLFATYRVVLGREGV